jgi:serine/threonine-protein kinase RsbW
MNDDHRPGGLSAEWSFARRVTTPGHARRLVRAQLARWGVDKDAAGTAELLLSELVTNSVRHATRPPGRLVAVRAELAPERLLRVEVADASSAVPKPAPGEDPEAESGRGLVLVEGLAAAWGTYPRPYVGKVVWFTLALTGEAAEALCDVTRPAPGEAGDGRERVSRSFQRAVP